jgi:hypothetical protein
MDRMDSCQSLCTTQFPAMRCHQTTLCDASLGEVCRGMFWADSLRDEFRLVDENPRPIPDVTYPVTCDEARDKLSRKSLHKKRSASYLKSEPSKRKRKLQFKDVIREESVFHKDFPPAQIGIDSADPGINSGAFTLLSNRLAGRMDVSLRLTLGARFPGLVECLGPGNAAVVEEPDGSEVLVRFDQASFTGSRKHMLSRDGHFVLSHVPITSYLRKKKAIQLELNRFGDFAVALFPIRSGSMTKECESQLVVEEAFGSPLDRDELGETDPNTAFLLAARAIESIAWLHSLGLLHRNIERAFVWDGKNPETLKIRELEDVQFFVNDHGEHVPVTSCSVDDSGKIVRNMDPEFDCLSRASDIEELAQFLLDLFGLLEPLMDDLVDFSFYASMLPLRAKPEYQKWIDRFRSAARQL